MKLSEKGIGLTFHQALTPEYESHHATADDQRCQISSGVAFAFETKNMNSNAPKSSYIVHVNCILSLDVRSEGSDTPFEKITDISGS